MFGGPWYSNGAARVIGNVTYHYKRVSYAHWARYYGARSHWRITRGRRVIANVETDAELEALFDRIAAGEVIQPLSERERLARLQARNERAAARAARAEAKRPLYTQTELAFEGGAS